MEFTFKKATKAQARLRLAVVGPSGAGKTFTALSIAQHLGARVAVIDTEHGSASKYADRFNFDVLELSSFAPRTYIEALRAADSAGFDVVVIDSLSHAWMGKDGALEQVDRIAKRTGGGNTFGAWRDVTPQHNELVEALLGCRAHLIVTMRAKMEYVQEKDERTGKTTVRKVGLAPVQRDGVEYEFDVVGDMTIDHDMVVTKTRCSELSGGVFTRPGAEVAKILRAWLESGEAKAQEPTPPPPSVESRSGSNEQPAGDHPTELPAALESFNARVAEIELPGEAVAVWIKHRTDLSPLATQDRESAWRTLCARVESVGKMKNAKVWLKKAIAEEDARRSANGGSGDGPFPREAAPAARPWHESPEGMRARADALPDAAAVLADAREHHSLVGYGPVLIDRLVALGVAREQASADVPRVMREARERAPRDDGPRGGKKPASVPPPADVQGDRTAANDSGAQPSASVTVLPGLPEWATTADGIAAHMSTLTARAHLENSVRLHGRRLGEAYKTPAVARLVAIDTPADDGRRLTEIGARILVDGWAHQGPRKTVRRDVAVR